MLIINGYVYIYVYVKHYVYTKKRINNNKVQISRFIIETQKLTQLPT